MWARQTRLDLHKRNGGLARGLVDRRQGSCGNGGSAVPDVVKCVELWQKIASMEECNEGATVEGVS